MKATNCFPVILLVTAGGCAVAPSIRSQHNETRARPDVDDPTAAEISSDLPWGEEPEVTIRDPLEPVNRVFFQVNDRLYFWVLKPVATGYKNVVPEGFRISVRNFFSNLATPVRLSNCLLQGKFEGAGVELSRFVINTTIGVAGLGDPAQSRFNLKKRDEDLGQTLGCYGLGPGFYLVWPVLGPSSARDTLGTAADGFLDPIVYLVPSLPARVGIRTFDRINEASLRLGAYEALSKAALDPYVALRDAYVQRRQSLIDE